MALFFVGALEKCSQAGGGQANTKRCDVRAAQTFRGNTRVLVLTVLQLFILQLADKDLKSSTEKYSCQGDRLKCLPVSSCRLPHLSVFLSGLYV